MKSDVEIVDEILGSFSRDDERNEQSENELNLDSASSRPQQNSNLAGEDFRSLLNTNSRENSEITIETNRIIGDETASHVTRKLNDIKSSLNLQIQEAINTAITEKVLPSIENSLLAHGRANLTMGDHWSSGLQRNSEVINPQKTKGNLIKMRFSCSNLLKTSRDSSVDSYTRKKLRHGNRSQPYATIGS